MASVTHPRIRRQAGTRAGYHRILWPTDLSATSEAARDHVVELAAETSAGLVLLHVVPSLAAYAVPEIAGAGWIGMEWKIRAGAQAQLRRLEEQVRQRQVRTHALVIEGVPFLQILRVADRLRCDVIVLATRGHSGPIHSVLGSVAANVLRRAPCPVLMVGPARIERAA
jgi:nucleotide-binding universal stress UspA family protein